MNEPAVGDGVVRELFSIFSYVLFAPQSTIFLPTPTHCAFTLRPQPPPARECEFAGRVCAMAVIQGVPLGARIFIGILKRTLGITVKWSVNSPAEGREQSWMERSEECFLIHRFLFCLFLFAFLFLCLVSISMFPIWCVHVSCSLRS